MGPSQTLNHIRALSKKIYKRLSFHVSHHEQLSDALSQNILPSILTAAQTKYRKSHKCIFSHFIFGLNDFFIFMIREPASGQGFMRLKHMLLVDSCGKKSFNPHQNDQG